MIKSHNPRSNTIINGIIGTIKKYFYYFQDQSNPFFKIFSHVNHPARLDQCQSGLGSREFAASNGSAALRCEGASYCPRQDVSMLSLDQAFLSSLALPAQEYTVWPRSLDPSYVVTHYKNWPRPLGHYNASFF